MAVVLAPGMRVGRYRLLFRLGKGGMGEVWAAAQGQADLGFQKLVALKVLETHDVTSNAAVMFFDEAKAASVLQHAAIVSTTDLGQDGNLLYIAMDLVQGPSLTALLQRLVITRRTMSPAVVTRIGIDMSSALDYAHDRALVNGQPLKLVHRDVSPHNVLLDLNGSIRLTDFGVARTAIQDHESRVGTVRGKPSYMAPEQVVGGAIDARTDVFALGIVLYESACLKRLFGRSQPVKSMDAVLKHEPKPLPELVPDFPQTLWSVIRKALQKDPKNRFQSAGELNEALHTVAKGLPGYDRATRELVELMHGVFDAEDFATEARVQKANLESSPALPEPTRADRGVQVLGASMPWPSVDASDPLAPEAIEEAKTMYRPMATAAMAAPVMMSGSVDALTPSSSQLSYAGLVAPPPKRSMLPTIAVGVALLLVGTTAFVVASRNERSPLPAEGSSAAPERPVAATPPEVSPSPSATLRPTPPPPPPPAELAPPADAATEPKVVRRPAPVKRPATKPESGGTSAAPEADASYSEVLTLARKVRAVDPVRGKAMMATALEAGKDNVKKLNQLRKEAQEILAANGSN
ncbi:MAG: serine/threonine protein kinase [Deltaproteobacteria bacterium]|nr:serine/threonine protein kinase [Deltaproteobacteria bacterium]